MEGGRRKSKKTGKFIPAHYITDLTAEHKGKKVYTAMLSGGVSKNPFIAFKIKAAAKGDSLKVSWLDNNGKTDMLEVKIK